MAGLLQSQNALDVQLQKALPCCRLARKGHLCPTHDATIRRSLSLLMPVSPNHKCCFRVPPLCWRGLHESWCHLDATVPETFSKPPSNQHKC